MVETANPSPVEAVCQLPSDTLALLLSSVLERLCSLSADTRGTSTRFHSRELNATPVSDYCRRLAQWLPATNDTLLLSLVYARRLVWNVEAPLPASLKPSRHPRPIVNQWTIHRVILSLLSLASKFISDFVCSQARLAKVGGVSMKESTRLEVEMYAQLGFCMQATQFELDTAAAAILSAQQDTLDIRAFLAHPSPASNSSSNNSALSASGIEDEALPIDKLALSDVDVSPQVISPGLNNGISLPEVQHPQQRNHSPSSESTASGETVTQAS